MLVFDSGLPEADAHLLERLPGAVARLDASGTCRGHNHAVADLLGPERFGDSSPDRQAGVTALVAEWRTKKAGGPVRHLRFDAQVIWVDVEIGEPTDDGWTVVILRDVTVAHRLAAELEIRRGDAELLTKDLPVGIVRAGQDGQILYCNEVVKTITGRDPVVEGIRSHDMIHPDDHEQVAEAFFASFAPGRPSDWVAEFRVVRPSGAIRWVRSFGRTMFDNAGAPSGVSSSWLDATEEIDARNESERFVHMLGTIPDPVLIIDEELKILYANAAGWAHLPEDAQVHRIYNVLSEESWLVAANVAVPTARREGSWVGELWSYDRQGVRRPFIVSLTLRRDLTTGKEYATTICRDISELRELHRKLEQQANHDPLTGLANRRLLYDRIDTAIATRSRTKPEGGVLGVLFIDLDLFKEVNDRFGHEVGDFVLSAVAERLRTVADASGMVARIGGDEFVVVADGCASEQAVEDLGEVIVNAMTQRFMLPVTVGEDLPVDHVVIGASVGWIAWQYGRTTEELLRAADGAAYVAKGTGRGRVSQGVLSGP